MSTNKIIGIKKQKNEQTLKNLYKLTRTIIQIQPQK